MIDMDMEREVENRLSQLIAVRNQRMGMGLISEDYAKGDLEPPSTPIAVSPSSAFTTSPYS